MTVVLMIALFASILGIVIMIMERTGLTFLITLSVPDLTRGFGLVESVIGVAICLLLLGAIMPVYAIMLLLSGTPLFEMGLPAMSVTMFFLFFGMLAMLTPPFGFVGIAASARGWNRSHPHLLVCNARRLAGLSAAVHISGLAWPRPGWIHR